MKELCNCILTNIYFKVFFVTIFASVLTFVDEIDFLQNKFIIVVLITLFVLLLFTQDCDRGAIILVVSLLILCVNNVGVHQKDIKKNDA